MRLNKSQKIIAIVVIAIFIIVLGVFVYAFFETDLFKTNEEIFLKYFSNISSVEYGLIDEDLNKFNTKKTTTPYNDEGEISFNSMSDEIKEVFENMIISYVSENNRNNLEKDLQINIDIDSNISLPTISIKNRSEETAFKIDNVISKNIIMDTDSSETLNVLANIPSKIDGIDWIEVSKGLNKYLETVKTNLTQEDFSKVAKNGYKLSLSQERYNAILIQLLSTLKDDTDLLKQIESYCPTELIGYSQKELKEIIENQIKELQQLQESGEFSGENFEITIYIQDKSINKILVQIPNEGQFEIEKISQSGKLEYDINVNFQNINIEFVVKYEGLDKLEEVTSNYNVKIETTEFELGSSLTGKTEFKTIANIEELNEENSIEISEKTSEYREKLMKAIIDKYIQIVSEKFQEIGVNINNVFSGNSNNSELTELEVNAFNSNFELYQSTSTKGATVKGLLTTIKESNQENEEMQITEINFNGDEYEATEQNITVIKSEILVDDEYKVEFEKDVLTGLINRVVINKK
jgi:hypothetical protein